jgi:myo-inositol-1(or 4)-monophosphatase
VDDPALLDVLGAAAAAVREALDRLDDWGPAGTRPGQYRSDLAADAAAVAVLHGAGLAVLSEESGLTGEPSAELVVLDPLDGSTNAARGIPWYATSLCVIDDVGPRVAVVVDQARGVTFEAVRGEGARRDGHPLAPSGCRRLADAVVGVSGLPSSPPGWAQFRALGAAALDLCAVAGGVLDGYRAVGTSWLHPWDYLGGVLVCQEAGAVVGEAGGAELVVREAARRRPVAAATPELLSALIAAGI